MSQRRAGNATVDFVLDNLAVLGLDTTTAALGAHVIGSVDGGLAIGEVRPLRNNTVAGAALSVAGHFRRQGRAGGAAVGLVDDNGAVLSTSAAAAGSRASRGLEGAGAARNWTVE